MKCAGYFEEIVNSEERSLEIKLQVEKTNN